MLIMHFLSLRHSCPFGAFGTTAALQMHCLCRVSSLSKALQVNEAREDITMTNCTSEQLIFSVNNNKNSTKKDNCFPPAPVVAGSWKQFSDVVNTPLL